MTSEVTYDPKFELSGLNHPCSQVCLTYKCYNELFWHISQEADCHPLTSAHARKNESIHGVYRFFSTQPNTKKAQMNRYMILESQYRLSTILYIISRERECAGPAGSCPQTAQPFFNSRLSPRTSQFALNPMSRLKFPPIYFWPARSPRSAPPPVQCGGGSGRDPPSTTHLQNWLICWDVYIFFFLNSFIITIQRCEI